MTTPNRQIPWVGIDGVRAWQAGDLAIVNQVPDAASTGAAVDTDIEFLLLNTTGAGGGTAKVDQSSLNVWVKKSATDFFEQAVLNGVAQGSWGLTLEEVGPSDIDLKVILDPPYEFASEALVSVRVVADVVGGGYAIDETYSFEIGDFVSPQITSALGWQPTKARVVYDKSMGASAAIYTNYSNAPYQPDRRGVVSPSIIACTQISTTVFEVEFAYELSPGAQYTITASGVYDTFGNLIDPAADSAVFTAYDFRDSGRAFRGWKMYQQLAEYDRRGDMKGDLERLLSSHQYFVDYSLMEIDNLDHLTNPDRAPFDYLLALLYDLGDPLPFVTDERQRRRVAWRAVELHKKRGTAGGIKLAVELVTGLDCEVVRDRDRRWKLGVPETCVFLLVNNLYFVYEGHREEIDGGVHGAKDETNVITVPAPATTLAECYVLTNNIKLNYGAHRVLTAGGVHGAADTINVVTAFDATDCYSCALLANNLKKHIEAHRVLTAGGVHGAEDTVNVVTEAYVGNRLGYDTILGSGPKDLYSFWLEFDQALTAAQRAIVERVATVMRTAHTHYLGPIEP